jgi:hypothetical protein
MKHKISPHDMERMIKSEVIKIKDTVSSSVRNVQVDVNRSKDYGGKFDFITENIIISLDDAYSSDDPIARAKFVLWHEFRHALQHTKNILRTSSNAVHWMDDKPVPFSKINLYMQISSIDYCNLPWEYDANAFAAENVPEYRGEHPLNCYKQPLKVLF